MLTKTVYMDMHYETQEKVRGLWCFPAVENIATNGKWSEAAEFLKNNNNSDNVQP